MKYLIWNRATGKLYEFEMEEATLEKVGLLVANKLYAGVEDAEFFQLTISKDAGLSWETHAFSVSMIPHISYRGGVSGEKDPRPKPIELSL